jgi:hypothetical protein
MLNVLYALGFYLTAPLRCKPHLFYVKNRFRSAGILPASPALRDFTSIFMEIKVFNKPLYILGVTGLHEEDGIHVNNHSHRAAVKYGGMFKQQLTDKFVQSFSTDAF